METIWRLAWAMPLVLMVGAGMALILKRFVVPGQQPRTQPARRMSVCESLSLSEDTRVHLIEVDCQTFLVVESARHTTVEPARHEAIERAPARGAFGPRWLQHYQVRAR